MNDAFSSILPSIAILGALAVIALYLTLTRSWQHESRKHIRSAVQIAVATIFFQATHFTEELLTGFHARFPALFGRAPMPLPFFVSFNVAWLLIWSLCAWGLAHRKPLALFPLWFLGIACIANGVAHPVFAALAGGYFPGLVTSPVVGILGVLLLRRLLFVTMPLSQGRVHEVN